MKANSKYTNKKVRVVEEKLYNFKEMINSNNRFGVR
jgi:hypothetical protein